jgi:hypothetical protein
MNGHENEGWWSEEYWATSEFEDARNFLLWFGHWFVEFVVVVLFLAESILYIFHFLSTRLSRISQCLRQGEPQSSPCLSYLIFLQK